LGARQADRRYPERRAARPQSEVDLNERDFERLYAEHAGALLAFLVYRTGDRAMAEDLLADTFERVIRARSHFDRRRASEKTWIYAIALNCLRGHRRRAAAESRAMERVEVSVAAAGGRIWTDPVDARDALSRGLATLSAEEREAIALRYGAELTLPDISKVTKQPLTTVEGRVYRALRKLREALDEGTS
jgi:RNA polymerase sigma-70 factor, ECF subfamily